MSKPSSFGFASLAGLIAVCGFFFVSPLKADAAASLYLNPSAGTFIVGSTFTVSVYVDTGGQAVNAVETDLVFPPDKLQVVSPSAGKSFIQTWVTQPTYSNVDGTIKFQGALPSPGINTSAGLISTVTFRVKSVGTASIKFSDGSHVLLNDGKGTDVLDRTTGGIYYVTLPPPEGPLVTSRTDPDQEQWDRSQTAAFEWVAPPDIEGYSYVLDDNPGTIPDDISEGTNTRVVYDNPPDGEHYFHIKALRQNAWGGVTTYAVRIDRTPPADFTLDFLPSRYTSRSRPVISFDTTDNVSGIDHYEMAIISLDKSVADADNTPFFVEVTSPYVGNFNLGRYQIVVRAYDKAGNYSEAQASLQIVNPIFEIIGSHGVRLWGLYSLSWPYAGAAALILLIILFFIARWLWKLHVRVEEYLRHGVAKHPQIAPKLDELKEKREKYGGDAGSKLGAIAILFFLGIGLLMGNKAQAQGASVLQGPPPPAITLYPRSISNDEIFYIGGTAAIPGSQVLLYLERSETNATVEKTITPDDKGNWFYSFPQFLDSGHYVVWAQLKVGEALSPPSPQVDLTVAPTAFQIGTNRLSAESFYLIMAIIFLFALLILIGFIVYHGYHVRRKNRHLREKIKEADESIRRGFLLLRKDIETELALIHTIKLSKGLSVEEKAKEEKVLKDLEETDRYVDKEIWDMEKDES